MEMRRRAGKRWLLRGCLCILLVFAVCPAQSQKSYGVRNGRMFIALARTMAPASLDSFISRYDLREIGLFSFLRAGKDDSIRAAGWLVEQNNTKGILITKSLQAADNLSSPENRIGLTNERNSFAVRFPSVSADVRYGVNRFRNQLPYEVRGGKARFFLRGHEGARAVSLSGSFNDWAPDAIRMTRVAGGWVAQVPLLPGKWWYKFVVDGNWIADPDNRVSESDGEGNTNSVFFRPNTVFTLHGHMSARKAYVAGNFNNWRKTDLPMIKTPIGWELPLYLAEGTHTYKYIVNGQWIADERQAEKLPDGQGGFNSVYRIGKAYLFALTGFETAKEVVLAGSFNGWRDDEWTLRRTKSGWELPLTLGPGNYEYRFRIDGRWITDPGNPLSSESGGHRNSFLAIGANYNFRLAGHANARAVFVAGDFNNWNPNGLAMKRVGNDWVFSIHLTPGKHLYKFNVDGEWIIDPANPLWEQNEYGTGNSVIWANR
jgi:hypothetical protein